MKIEVPKDSVDDVVKRYFWLAWKAAGGTLGMGALQDRPGSMEDDVFQNVLTGRGLSWPRPPYTSSLRADYVFGRMLKVGIETEGGILEASDGDADPEYQAWSHKYKSPADLLVAAVGEVIETEQAETGA